MHGITLSHAPILLPDLRKAYIARELDHELEKGESSTQFAQRVQTALETIRERHSGGTVLLVSHSSTLDMMYAFLAGRLGILRALFLLPIPH